MRGANGQVPRSMQIQERHLVQANLWRSRVRDLRKASVKVGAKAIAKMKSLAKVGMRHPLSSQILLRQFRLR